RAPDRAEPPALREREAAAAQCHRAHPRRALGRDPRPPRARRRRELLRSRRALAPAHPAADPDRRGAGARRSIVEADRAPHDRLLRGLVGGGEEGGDPAGAGREPRPRPAAAAGAGAATPEAGAEDLGMTGCDEGLDVAIIAMNGRFPGAP